MTTNILDAVKNLPLAERVVLVEALWESIVQDGYEPDITKAQAEEFDRRLAEHETNPKDVVSWEAVKVELELKYGKP